MYSSVSHKVLSMIQREDEKNEWETTNELSTHLCLTWEPHCRVIMPFRPMFARASVISAYFSAKTLRSCDSGRHQLDELVRLSSQQNIDKNAGISRFWWCGKKAQSMGELQHVYAVKIKSNIAEERDINVAPWQFDPSSSICNESGVVERISAGILEKFVGIVLNTNFFVVFSSQFRVIDDWARTPSLIFRDFLPTTPVPT